MEFGKVPSFYFLFYLILHFSVFSKNFKLKELLDFPRDGINVSATFFFSKPEHLFREHLYRNEIR
jgi:hypothetical protein